MSNQHNPFGGPSSPAGFSAFQQPQQPGFQQPQQQQGFQQPQQQGFQQPQQSANPMMGNGGAADIMSGFGGVSVGGVGVYLEDGLYVLEITELKNGQAPMGGFPFFVAEFRVIESTNPARPVGSRVEWMVAFKNRQFWTTYQSNVKRFLLAAWQSRDPSVTEDAINEQVWARSVAQDQPLRGVRVMAETVTIPQKNDRNKNFAKTVFSPYKEGQAALPPPAAMPPAQYAPPVQQGYAAPPAQGFEAPPQQHQQGFGPPPQQQGGFGPPPQQQGGFGPPAQQGFGPPPVDGGGWGQPQ